MTGRLAPADRAEGLTLAVTSSTGVMGLALGRVADDGVDLLGQVEIATDRRHAEEISPRMAHLLADAELRMADVERLAVDIGPGRFTGLRVGLATVRALGFALQVPIVGLSSLAVLAAGADSEPGGRPNPGPVTAVIDARRGEVFQQTFHHGEPVAPATVGDPAELAVAAAAYSSDSASGRLLGDGLDRYLDLYRPVAEQHGLETLEGRTPKAAVMLELSCGRPGRPGTEIEPLYLRDPDATPNIKTRVGSGPS
jgi:tRNA threonylcarbamoyladenosine biosynthesis protein TsaB